MPWWGWILIGTALLGVELFFIPTDFFLVFLGAAAVGVGALGFAGLALPAWGQWALFGLLSAASLIGFRGWHRRGARPGAAASRADDTLLGEIGIVREALAAGGHGQIELRGVPWTARNLDAAPLEPGARARVERVVGLTLEVRRAP